jgi:hypothetical protein
MNAMGKNVGMAETTIVQYIIRLCVVLICGKLWSLEAEKVLTSSLVSPQVMKVTETVNEA